MSKLTLLPLLLASLGVVALPACQNTPSSSRLMSWQVSRLADLGALALMVTHPSRQ